MARCSLVGVGLRWGSGVVGVELWRGSSRGGGRAAVAERRWLVEWHDRASFSVWGLWAGFAVVLGVELGACWCGDDVSARFVGVFGDGPAVCVEYGVVWFAK